MTRFRSKTAIQFGGFVSAARPGQRCVYHVGCLIDDRATSPQVNALADIAALAGEAGLVSLHHRRVRDGVASYVAIRTQRKGWAW